MTGGCGGRYVEEKAVRIGRFVRTGPVTRLARRLWMGKNPLRRSTDRIEAWITAGLLVLFLVGAPLSWIAVGRWVQQAGLIEQRAQQSWHQIPAVLLKSAPTLPRLDLRASWGISVLAPARWAGPGGRYLTGKVPVLPGTRAGRTGAVWVNSSGRPTGPPLARSGLVNRVVSSEMLAPVGLAAVLFGVGVVVRLIMDRRRLAGWEARWALVGPRWTKHR
jgi:hypothetical protein